MTRFDIATWVNEDAGHRAFRQAVHTILTAISDTHELQQIMVMKGGILLALGYGSTRFTRDIDFSTDQTAAGFDIEDFIAKFDQALTGAAEILPYDTDCRVQGWKKQPPRDDATFPTIEIKVGYANRSNSGAHRRLMRSEAPHVVRVDFSLNEPRGGPVLLEIGEGRTIQAYSFEDLVAEKLRAVLQQEVRNRTRRQDIYDLYLLLNDGAGQSEETRSGIFDSLKEKAAARDLTIDRKSMRNHEIYRRSHREYELLVHEIEGPLPEFDVAYDLVRSYYEALPWRDGR